jgi:hypothetical protein
MPILSGIPPRRFSDVPDIPTHPPQFTWSDELQRELTVSTTLTFDWQSKRTAIIVRQPAEQVAALFSFDIKQVRRDWMPDAILPQRQARQQSVTMLQRRGKAPRLTTPSIVVASLPPDSIPAP